jgi:hypothetical protein
METGIARGSLPGTTMEVQRVGFPFAEIWSVSRTYQFTTLFLQTLAFPTLIAPLLRLHGV